MEVILDAGTESSKMNTTNVALLPCVSRDAIL